MPKETFTVWDNVTFDDTPVTGNGQFTLATSATIQNNNDYDSLKIVIEYDTVVPVSNSRAFELMVGVEFNNDDTPQRWYPAINQFEGFTRDARGTIRELVMQPNLVVVDPGIDEVLAGSGGETVARISRLQGKSSGEFRIVLTIIEWDFGGPGAFQSATLNVYGEKYNA